MSTDNDSDDRNEASHEHRNVWGHTVLNHINIGIQSRHYTPHRLVSATNLQRSPVLLFSKNSTSWFTTALKKSCLKSNAILCDIALKEVARIPTKIAETYKQINFRFWTYDDDNQQLPTECRHSIEITLLNLGHDETNEERHWKISGLTNKEHDHTPAEVPLFLLGVAVNELERLFNVLLRFRGTLVFLFCLTHLNL